MKKSVEMEILGTLMQDIEEMQDQLLEQYSEKGREDLERMYEKAVAAVAEERGIAPARVDRLVVMGYLANVRSTEGEDDWIEPAGDVKVIE